jgi:hypothetical protein
MINLYKPVIDIAKAIIDKVPPWVWAVLVLGGLWLGSLYAVYRLTTDNATEACAQRIVAMAQSQNQVAVLNDRDSDALKAKLCDMRTSLAACQATLAAKPVPPKVVVRRVDKVVDNPEPESCE